MAKNETVDVQKVDSLFDDLDRLQQAIRERAYDLFRSGTQWSDALLDWLTAERELVRRPPVELRQEGNHFELVAALPGVDPSEVEVRVTSEDVLIKTNAVHEHAAGSTVHICELGRGKIFRTVHFPETIDPDSVKAEFKNGMLTVRAVVAKATAKKVNIKAA